MAPPQNYDIVIIGGGISGLTAAHELKKKAGHLKIAILEAKDRVGGRTLTVSLKAAQGTDQWDLGGQWVGTTQTHILSVLGELGLQTYPQFSEGKKLGQLGSEKISVYNEIPHVGKWFLRKPLETLDRILVLKKMEDMSKRISSENPFADPDARYWDTKTVSQFVKETCMTRTVRDSIETICQEVLGQRPTRVSLLYFLLYGRAAGSWKTLVEAAGDGAQGFKVDGGTQQISTLLAGKVGWDNIFLNHPVSKIVQDEDGVEVFTRNGGCFSCKRLICSIPPQQAGVIEYVPALPEEKIQLFNGFPMGNLSKVILTYAKPFWREMGFSGEVEATGKTKDPKFLNPIIETYDATSHRGNPAIVAFINVEWWRKSKEERRQGVLKDLSRFFGPEAMHPIEYAEKNWSEEPYNGGCPVACMPPGNMENYALTIRAPTGKIHWAGTETATQWIGYMSGAAESGLRVAHEILHHLQPASVENEKLQGSIYQPGHKQPELPTPHYRKMSIARRLSLAKA